MNRGLYIGKSGMQSFQAKLDLISNNIANSQTSGYKKVNANFQELLRDEIGMLGTPLSEQIEGKNPTIGTGVKLGNAFRNMNQGILTGSTNSLELGMEGEGFFTYQDAAGNVLLSRVANLAVNINTGSFVDENGNVMQLAGQQDFRGYTKDEIKINTEGQISVPDADGNFIAVSQIISYYVPNKDNLLDSGKGYFMLRDPAAAIASNAAGADPTLFGQMKQGYVEASNVNMADELVDLMITQRGYQLSLKSVQTADEMWSQANNLLKR